MSRSDRIRELPPKRDPAEFGGGRTKGFYTNAQVRKRLCSRAGCGRAATSTWGACADGNVQRPLCAEDDYRLNVTALFWLGDPDAEAKLLVYRREVEEAIGRPLELDED